MQEEIHANPNAAKRREAGKKKRTRPNKVTPHDGDIFTISLNNGKSYIGQVIATPNYANTYTVIFDLLVDEEEASEHIAEALSSSPLLAGLAISPFKVRPTWEIIANRQLTKRGADRFLLAYFINVKSKGTIEDFYCTRSRRASPTEASAALRDIMNEKGDTQEQKFITA